MSFELHITLENKKLQLLSVHHGNPPCNWQVYEYSRGSKNGPLGWYYAGELMHARGAWRLPDSCYECQAHYLGAAIELWYESCSLPHCDVPALVYFPPSPTELSTR